MGDILTINTITIILASRGLFMPRNDSINETHLNGAKWFFHGSSGGFS